MKRYSLLPSLQLSSRVNIPVEADASTYASTCGTVDHEDFVQLEMCRFRLRLLILIDSFRRFAQPTACFCEKNNGSTSAVNPSVQPASIREFIP